MDNAVLLLLEFAKRKNVKFLTDAQVNKAIYMLQVNSLEYVGKKFCDADYHRYDRGPISVDVRSSLEKLYKLRYIDSKNVEIKKGRNAHQHYFLGKKYKSVFDKNKALFAISTFQLLEKKYPKFLNGKGKITTLGSYDTEPMKNITIAEKKAGKKFVGMPIDFQKVSLNFHILDILKTE